MRATCAVLIAVLSFGGSPLVSQARAQSKAETLEPTESAEQLYEDGRKAYRLGRYEEAAKKFERSFELSDQPLLLYNIALAYKRLYSISKDVGDLRRSKNVFEEFITVAQADTALQTEIEDARARLEELDQEIAQAEEAAAKSNSGPAPVADQPTIGPRERKLRIAGAVTMGVGGALLLAGIGMGTFYAVRAGAFSDDERREKEALPNTACHADRPISQLVAMGCPEDRVRRLATFRDNAEAARLGAGLGFGLVGGLGVVALVTGAVLFVKGTPRAGKGRVADLRVVPALDGIVVSGRF